jgi:predicted dehydrogenase
MEAQASPKWIDREVTREHHPLITQIAVCGAGAFGRNHIRIYRELAAAGAPIRLAAIVEPDLASAAAFAGTPHVAPEIRVQQNPAAPHLASETRVPQNPASPRIFSTTEALLAAIAAGELTIDAASVCTPTSTHHEVASQLLAAGIHVLVEKPIAATLDQADDLITLAAKHQRTLTVGHLERFNPAVQALEPLLRGPMFFEAHRLSIFSPRSLDTDVILDLMIHDLDIVLHLVQSSVTQVHAVGLPILSGKTDIANVRIQFANGCVANFTASRVSTERVRKLRFFQPHQYLSLDYARQDLLVIEVIPPQASPSYPIKQTAASAAVDVNNLDTSYPGENKSHPERSSSAPAKEPVFSASLPDKTGAGAPHLSPETETAIWHPQKPASPPPALPTLGMHKPQVTPAEPLRLEIESFLHSIQTGAPSTVTAKQARNALALALQIQQAIAQHAQHAGLQAFTTR